MSYFRRSFIVPCITLCIMLLAASPLFASISSKSKHHTKKSDTAKGSQKQPAKRTFKASTEKKQSPQKITKKTKRVSTRKSVAVRQARELSKRSAAGPLECATDNNKMVSAKSAIVIDVANGNVLYAYEPDRPGQPASTLKILTGGMAIQSLDDHSLVPVSGNAAEMPPSKVSLKPGRLYYADDLINAVLLASANDASVALAERIAGSEEKFASRITAFAHDLGAQQTICKTANGLTAEGQQTTARDLASIFNKLMKNQEFASRMAKTTTRTRFGMTLRNHNKALWRVAGAVGGKTGYTNAARQTYVGKFRRGGDEIIVAILGSESMWNDISRLVEYGFSMKSKNKIPGLQTVEVDFKKPLKGEARLQQALQMLSSARNDQNL